MNIKNILAAAATAAVLTVGGVSAASAAPWFGHGYHETDRRIVEHRVVFETLRFHHIRYTGTPYFVRDHYVVRSFDRFGHVTFVEVNPYTGAFVGFIRL